MRVLCKENENYPEIEVDKSYEAIPMILNPGTVDYMDIHRMLENTESSIYDVPEVDYYQLPGVSENILYPSRLFYTPTEVRDILINKIIDNE